MSANFVAAVTIHSHFEAKENKICQFPTFPPSVCNEVMETATSLPTVHRVLFAQHSCQYLLSLVLDLLLTAILKS